MIKSQKTKLVNGFTLLEILVVILIFSTIGILATQTLVLSLKGSKKSESLVRVKQNVEYSLSFMERALRTSKEIDSCTDERLQFLDQDSEVRYFHCDGTSIFTDYAEAAHTQITSPDVEINCTSPMSPMFVCDTTSTPHSVEITIEASDASVIGAEGAQVSSSTRILMRNY